MYEGPTVKILQQHKKEVTPSHQGWSQITLMSLLSFSKEAQITS